MPNGFGSTYYTPLGFIVSFQTIPVTLTVFSGSYMRDTKAAHLIGTQHAGEQGA